MRNLAVTIRYNGKRYHGWQVQKNAVTVQQVFQDALAQIIGVRPDVKGCSRTDAGVHANMYVVCFKIEKNIGCTNIVKALNHMLPEDIAAYACEEKTEGFHARYSCMGKEYIYKVWNSPNRNPFYSGLALQYAVPLDARQMDSAAQHFLGTHDFSAFCASGSSVTGHIRTVKRCAVKQEGEMITFSVEADGFLYNMVRIMTGTLIDVSCGKISPEEVPGIIASLDRKRAGVTAPPEGLYLNQVFY